MPGRTHLSPESEREDRDDRDQLRTLEKRFNTLLDQRTALIAEMRKLSAEQKALYDRRQAPQAEAERLHSEHGQLGRRLAELRSARDAARRKVDDAVIRRRELMLSFAPGERVNPDQIRREIAELEHHQQTRALPLDEENALIARLRKRTAELKQVEARTSQVAEHQRQLKDADAAIAAARAEVGRLGDELVAARQGREARMGEIKTKLEAAGSMVAEMRAKGKARAELMDRIDALGKEIDAVDREGRALLARSRARREEARRVVRTYARGRGRPTEDALASAAEAQFEELMKRGKVTLGG